MTEFRRIPLVFGGSLDRESGSFAVSPGGMEVLKNVIQYEGKIEVRRGSLETAFLVDEADNRLPYGLALQALRPERIGIGVGYGDLTRRVHVNRVAGDGGGVAYVDEWFTLESIATGGTLDPTFDPPIIRTAETRGRVYLAHDEPIGAGTIRAPTMVYDPNGSPELATLDGDLDDDGTYAPIRFRGVIAYLKYLFGWGYGTDAVPDSPHTLRVSMPGLVDPFDPLKVFDANHYWNLGQPRDPIVTCGIAGDVERASRLLVFKQTQTYGITGTGRGNFGEQLVDPRYGCAASRLALSALGFLFVWSIDGPRFSEGGTLEDLSIPLDLGGPSPDQLAADGALDYGFAEFVPSKRIVLFVFGRKCYALSIRSRPWKWSYWEKGFYPGAAGILIAGGLAAGHAVTTAPTGSPVVAGHVVTDTSIEVQVTNTGTLGGEILELWVKPAAGAWAKAKESGTGGAPTTFILAAGLTSGILYDYAVRYRRNGLYDANYSNPDPTNWPAISRGSATTGFASPANPFYQWERTAWDEETITLSWTNLQPLASTNIRRSVGGAIVHTALPGVTSWEDDSFTPETAWIYTLEHDTGTVQSAETQLPAWGGPRAPTNVALDSVEVDKYFVTGNVAPESWTYDVGSGPQPPLEQVEVEDRNDTDLEAYALAATVAVAAGTFSHTQTEAAQGGDTYSVRVRKKVISFPVVIDFSDFAPEQQVVLRA